MDERTKRAALRRARTKLGAQRRERTAFPMSSTTAEIAGRPIAGTVGVVVAEVVRVGDFVSNLLVNIQDGWGGRSKALEELLTDARLQCLDELRRRARLSGGNALVGVRLDVEMATKSLIVVVGSATAVVLQAAHAPESVDDIGDAAGDEEASDEELARCAGCGAELIAGEDGGPPACVACQLGGAASTTAADDGEEPAESPP